MTRTLPTVLACAALALVSACGGSSGPGPSAASGGSPTMAASGMPSATGSTAAGGGQVAIATESTAYGTVLATGSGHTLYALTADTSTKSTCTGACASIWPPLVVTAVPGFGSGVVQAKVGDVVRADGSHQLTYGGHPLYTFARDTAAGQTNGEGVRSFGGTWYVVSTSGQLVTTRATGSPTSSSSGYYGG